MKTLLDQFGRLRLLAGVFTLLPLLALPALGVVWLIQSAFGVWWLAAGLAALAVSWLCHWLAGRREAAALDEVRTEPGGAWPKQAQTCWERVQQRADEATLEEWPLDDPARLGQLAEQILRLVASHFHPHSARPLAEMTIPDTLMVIERAARELRLQVTENIPGSHRITLAQAFGARTLKGRYDEFKPFIKVLQLYFMPQALLRQILGDLLLGQVVQAGSHNVQRWLLGEYIRKIGYHAIELYGGLVHLDDGRPLEAATPGALEDLAQADITRAALLEPLRIVLLGRANAGKSSLVNALFGELVAATDVIPGSTAEITRYRLERDEQLRALVFDTPGFDAGGHETAEVGVASLEAAGLDADLVLWVTAANRPDRAEERAQLDRFRRAWADPARRAPPLVVALTQIDRLRPVREWAPPYVLDPPGGPKATQIAAAVTAAATDLGVEVATVIPVCAAPERSYNVDDALWAALLFELPEADRVRLLRCQRARRDAQDWGLLRGQLVQGGRILVSALRRRGTDDTADEAR
ncbi:MAG: 50S ribosome-binding GTPase [Gammaproteobacteria bacterium]|nr:50S ribosome-binding GTPase [Gammaproteobacteria bacterium]